MDTTERGRQSVCVVCVCVCVCVVCVCVSYLRGCNGQQRQSPHQTPSPSLSLPRSLHQHAQRCFVYTSNTQRIHKRRTTAKRQREREREKESDHLTHIPLLFSLLLLPPRLLHRRLLPPPPPFKLSRATDAGAAVCACSRDAPSAREKAVQFVGNFWTKTVGVPSALARRSLRRSCLSLSLLLLSLSLSPPLSLSLCVCLCVRRCTHGWLAVGLVAVRRRVPDAERRERATFFRTEEKQCRSAL